MAQENESRPLKGIGQILLGVALITFNDTCVKSSMADLGSGQAIFLRGAFVVIFMGGVFAWQGRLDRAIRVVNWRAQLWTAFLGALTLIFFVGSLPYLPLSTAILLVYASPVILACLAPRMLGEKAEPIIWVAAVIGLAGTVVVLRPGTTDFTPALLMPLVAAGAVAWRDVWTRRLVATETSESLFAFVIITALIGGGLVAPFDWQPLTTRAVLLLLASSVFLGFGILISIEAFRWAEASVLGPFKYTAILWAVAADALFWDKLPDMWTWAGGALIVVAGLLLVRRRSAA